ncbi:SCO0930 family lipoprotein [Streptomyces bauhiniae]
MAIWRSAAVALAAATVLLTAGCGASGSRDAGDAGSSASPESLASSSPVGEARNGPAGQLTLANDPNIGPILTDSTGFTLYRFATDGTSPLRSACEGECAKLWPPVPADGVVPPAGLDTQLLGSVSRADGSKQLTFAGLPMYRYAKDAKPGQVSGDKVNNAWFAELPADQVPGLEAALGAEAGAETGADTGAGSATASDAPTVEDRPGGAENGTADQALPGLSTVDDPDLGKIVVDGKGRTLYRYVKDTAWPMKAACTGACLDKWKPATVVGKNDVKGINPRLVIPFNRPDGIKQQTLDCWPLYWLATEKPGEIKGQGADGEWFAVAPDGSLVKK